MLAFKLWRGRVPLKTFESFLLSLFPILRNIQINTHKLKTVQKVVSEIFQINMKINLMKFERGRKKNQINRGFMLKDIASQSSGQNCFY